MLKIDILQAFSGPKRKVEGPFVDQEQAFLMSRATSTSGVTISIGHYHF